MAARCRARPSDRVDDGLSVRPSSPGFASNVRRCWILVESESVPHAVSYLVEPPGGVHAARAFCGQRVTESDDSRTLHDRAARLHVDREAPRSSWQERSGHSNATTKT